MTKKKAEVAVIKTAKATDEDLQNTLAALVDRNPNLGIALAYIITDSEGDGEGGSALVGSFNPHNMLHGVDTLMEHLMEVTRKIDPAGVESFATEMNLQNMGLPAPCPNRKEE